MVDEKAHLSKEERRQRQKRLERARCRVRPNVTAASPVVDPNLVTDAASSSPASPAKGPGRPKCPDITADDVSGLKYFEQLKPRLERLHDVGCERDQAGNRELHYDEFC